MRANEYQTRAMSTRLPSCENATYMLFGLMAEVAYGKPINFAGMKKICMFVASYIQSGRVFCLFVAGIFYALTLHIHGFVPPCGALMRPLPIQGGMQRESGTFFVYKFFRFFGEGSLSRL